MLYFNCEKMNQVFCKIVSGHHWQHIEGTDEKECMFCGCTQADEEIQKKSQLTVDID